MEPLALIALASAAGFVFKKMSRSDSQKGSGLRSILSRRSKTTPGKLSVRGSGIDPGEIVELPDYTFIKKLIDAQFPAVFVTGGAGTGKTTFVNWLMHQYTGQVLLAAPTALAATNIDGKTLHSLFQLPLQWITKSAIKNAPYRIDIQRAKLLIIDEISMVNANLLDGVSAFLRKNRGVDKPFGGLPIIMVGDLFQLPPVVGHGLFEFFNRYYDGKTKFYASKALIETSITYYAVEFRQTFRQADKKFVDILANIREGRNLQESVDTINQSCSITNTPPAGAVWLTPRRSEVERTNRFLLQKLPGRLIRFEGGIAGDYRASEENMPSPVSLRLRIGAQVMFTQNDPLKRWVNGTIGTVKSLSDGIVVQTQPYGKTVRVDKVKWSNFRYVWNKKSKSIEKKEVGSFTQYPLILAWAITIHKSQGKTLEKVHLDLTKGVFAFGQTYVALSRCRELGGLTLSRPLRVQDIKVDADSQIFNDHLHDLMEKLPQKKMVEALETANPSLSSAT